MRRKRASGESGDPRGLAGPAGEVGSWSLHARALTKPLSIHTPAPASVRAATLAPKTVGPQLPTLPPHPFAQLLLPSPQNERKAV